MTEWEKAEAGFLYYNFVVLAGNRIEIGDNVWIAPDCGLYAAGSIVTKSIPANVLAGGNPCKVIREIKPEDDDKYKRGLEECPVIFHQLLHQN